MTTVHISVFCQEKLTFRKFYIQFYLFLCEEVCFKKVIDSVAFEELKDLFLKNTYLFFMLYNSVTHLI